MKYGFIARHRTVWPVRVMCRVMTVSASGYYDWAARSPSQRSQTNAHLTTRIREALALLDIGLLDHLIIAGAASYSMAEQGDC